MKNVMKRCIFAAAAVLFFSLMSVMAVSIAETCRQWKQDHSGIPDAVSSVCSGRTCRLTVVANSDRIEDKERFISEVMRMYRANSFQTIRFSEDTGEEPEKLDITVYLKREDIGNEEPVMQICIDTAADESLSCFP